MNNNYWNLMMNCDFGTEVNPKIYALHDLWEKMEGKEYGAVNDLSNDQIKYLTGYEINKKPATTEWNMVQTLDLNCLQFTEEGTWSFWDYVERDLIRYEMYAIEQREEARKKSIKKTRRTRK